MKVTRTFDKGSYYSLEDISHITTFFKTIESRVSQHGVVHLYENTSDSTFWIGGPLRSNNETSFYFLGLQKVRKPLLPQIVELIDSPEYSEVLYYDDGEPKILDLCLVLALFGD